MEKLINLIEQYRQKNVLFAALTEPFQLIYRIYISIRYTSIRPLSCSGLYTLLLTVIAYVLARQYHFTIYFRIGIPVIAYLLAVSIDISLIQPYRRRDIALNRKRSINNTFGKNKWINEDPVEMAKALKLYRNVNDTDEWIFGRVGGLGKAVVTRRTKSGNKQIIIFGLAGSGKGTSQVILNTLQSLKRGIPCIVTSTKSDIWSRTSSIAKASEYENIWLLDLRTEELEFSDGFNPLVGINGDSTAADRLAHSITLNTSVGENPDYWYRGEKSLLCALIIVFSMMDGKDCSLPGIYRFLCSVRDVDEFEMMMDVLIKPGNKAYKYYKEFKDGPLKGEIYGAPGEGRYSTYKIGAQQPKQQVLQGVKMRLDFLDNPKISAILEHNDIDIRKLCESKSICYLVVDQTFTYRVLSSLFFTLAFWEFEAVAGLHNSSLPNGARVIIGDAFATGELPYFASTIATCRETGVELAYIMQDLPQLKQMYPDTYESILNNCSGKVLVNTDDIYETAPYFQSLCGTFTVLTPTLENGKETGRETETKADLAPIDFITNLGEKMLVILSEAKGPLLVEKQHYWDNMPGSRIKWKNPHNGKYYRAHPLLKYQEIMDVKEHKPAWYAKEEAAHKHSQKNSNKNKGAARPKVKAVTLKTASEAINDAEEL